MLLITTLIKLCYDHNIYYNKNKIQKFRNPTWHCKKIVINKNEATLNQSSAVMYLLRINGYGK